MKELSLPLSDGYKGVLLSGKPEEVLKEINENYVALNAQQILRERMAVFKEVIGLDVDLSTKLKIDAMKKHLKKESLLWRTSLTTLDRVIPSTYSGNTNGYLIVIHGAETPFTKIDNIIHDYPLTRQEVMNNSEYEQEFSRIIDSYKQGDLDARIRVAKRSSLPDNTKLDFISTDNAKFGLQAALRNPQAFLLIGDEEFAKEYIEFHCNYLKKMPDSKNISIKQKIASNNGFLGVEVVELSDVGSSRAYLNSVILDRRKSINIPVIPK